LTLDQEITEWVKELGMKVEKLEGNNFFQIKVTPPLGGPSVAILRPKMEDTYYIFTIVVDIDVETQLKVLRQIMLDLMRMNVEFFLTPQGKPDKLHLARLVFADELTKNQMLENLTLVKNAAYLAITWLKNGEDLQ
jgi:hypothetical protein